MGIRYIVNHYGNYPITQNYLHMYLQITNRLTMLGMQIKLGRARQCHFIMQFRHITLGPGYKTRKSTLYILYQEPH